MAGGKRKGAGRPPAPFKAVKKQVVFREDQVEYLKSLPKYTESKWVRDAVDEKIERDLYPKENE